jgi:hypothetical protein
MKWLIIIAAIYFLFFYDYGDNNNIASQFSESAKQFVGTDSCRSYSDFTCKQLENSNYNVYFWYPDSEKEYYLGKSTSLSMCGSMANNYAYDKNVFSRNWDYICCLDKDGSSCKEKHR